MPLKYRIKNREEIAPEEQRYYTEQDGVWVLCVEGAVEKAQLDEMREAHARTVKELAAVNARFNGIDPDEARKVAAEKRRLEEEQQLKAGEYEKVIETRLKAVRGELERQLAAVAAERDGALAQLATVQIDQAVVNEATKRGLRPSAIPDITARARSTFRLVDATPRAVEADGKTVRAGKDGVTPLSVVEWLDLQVTEAPHLFEGNSGAGTSGNGGAGATNPRVLRNPFRKETWNLTEQMRLQKSDPGLAARLQAAA